MGPINSDFNQQLITLTVITLCCINIYPISWLHFRLAGRSCSGAFPLVLLLLQLRAIDFGGQRDHQRKVGFHFDRQKVFGKRHIRPWRCNQVFEVFNYITMIACSCLKMHFNYMIYKLRLSQVIIGKLRKSIKTTGPS